jgi:hypothetical protein
VSFPQGGGFRLDNLRARTVVVAGGTGMGPLLPVVRSLVAAGHRPTVLASATHADVLPFFAELHALHNAGRADVTLYASREPAPPWPFVPGRTTAALGERVGGTVGYSVRGDSATSNRTRVEVVTTGVLLRRLQRDPSLAGIACVLLDEFHERGCDADLALALAAQSQALLRPELRIAVMSATLGGTLAALHVIASITGSAVLALAVAEGFIPGATAFRLSRIDETSWYALKISPSSRPRLSTMYW